MALFRRDRLPALAVPRLPDLAALETQRQALEEQKRLQRATLSPEAATSLREAGIGRLGEIWRRADETWSAQHPSGTDDRSNGRVFAGITASGTYVEAFQRHHRDEKDSVTTAFFLADPSDPDSLHQTSETEEYGLYGSMDAPPINTYAARAADGSEISLALPTESYSQKRANADVYGSYNAYTAQGGNPYEFTGSTPSNVTIADPYRLTIGGQSIDVMPIDRALQQAGLATEPLRPAMHPEYEQPV